MAGKKGEPATDSIMTAAEMKPLLMLSKREPVNAVIGMTKDHEGVILLNKRIKPKKLMAQLKADARKAKLELDTGSLRFGKAEVDTDKDSGLVMFTVNKDPPGSLRMKLLEVLRRVPYAKIEIGVDAKIEDEPEDDDDAEAGASANATHGASANAAQGVPANAAHGAMPGADPVGRGDEPNATPLIDPGFSQASDPNAAPADDPRAAIGGNPIDRLEENYRGWFREGGAFSRDWSQIANALEAFNSEAEIRKRLAEPLWTPENIASLHAAALANPQLGAGSMVARLTEPPPSAATPAATPAPDSLHVPIPIPLQVKVPVETSQKVWNDRIEIKWKGEIFIKATIGDGKLPGTVTMDLMKQQVGAKVTKDWWPNDWSRKLGGSDYLTDQTFTTDGNFKLGDVTIKAGYKVKTPIGEVAVSGTLVEWKTGKEVKYGAISIRLKGDVHVDDQELLGVPITHISSGASLEASVEPKYIKILADVILDKMGTAAAEAGFTAGGTGTLGAAAVAAAPVAGILGGFVGGFALTGAVCAGIAKLQDLGKECGAVCQEGARELHAYAESYGATMRGKPGGNKNGNTDAESTLQAIIAATPGLTHEQAIQVAINSKQDYEELAYRHMLPIMREQVRDTYREKQGFWGNLFSFDQLNRCLLEYLGENNHYH